MDIFEKVKDNIKITEVVEYFGVKLNSQNKGLCPFHKEKTPSFSVDPKTNIFTCFGCGATGDAIKFVEKIKGIEPIEAAKLLAEIFHIEIDEIHKTKSQNIIEYVKKCLGSINQTDYFEKRGLNKATIRKFCLGYDEYRKAVVIPYSSRMTYYQTRGTQEKIFFKPKTEDAGAEPLFNIEAMHMKTKEPIFVVESPICAMSIYQCGGAAVSTCGTSGWRKIIDEIKVKKPLGGFILCMDNDDPGRTASCTLAEELRKLDVQYIVYNIADDCKDPNELLMKSPKTLSNNVEKAKKELRKKYATAKDSFSASDLQQEHIDPPTWIIQDVLPTGLAMICAPSKIGKSWMMLQLSIAATSGLGFMDYKTNKCGVLYYALEDSKRRLKDRMMKILKGGKAPEALRFVTRADPLDKGLLEKIEEELSLYPDIRLVIIDTLQKVRGKVIKNESLYTGDYREMGELKDFADNHNICMLFVHHLRKMADESDVFNMISGSTALMGAADTIYVISKKKRNDVDATFSMTGRDIEQSDLIIAFNKADYKWEVKGTEEEIAAQKARAEYENDPLVITIKELVKRNPITGWKGTSTDLLKEIYDITGKAVDDSSTKIGKKIAEYETRLHYDDIDHKMIKRPARTHHFYKVVKNQYSYYQRSIEDDDNED